MNDNSKTRQMTVAEFFAALTASEDFIYAVAHTNSFNM